MSDPNESMDWTGYQPLPAAANYRLFIDPVKSGWEVLPRDEALALYEEVMSSRSERPSYVIELARRNGYDAGVELEQIAELNRFFLDNLPVYRGPETVHGTELIDHAWMSVIWDLAVLIGEVAIARNPNLRWGFHDANRRDALGRHSPGLFGHPEMGPSLPFLMLEGYAATICNPPVTRTFHVNGVNVPIEPPKVNPDLFRTLIAAEDKFS